MSEADELDFFQIDMPLNYVRGFEDAIDLLEDQLGSELTKNEELSEKLLTLKATAREKKLNLIRVSMMIGDT